MIRIPTYSYLHSFLFAILSLFVFSILMNLGENLVDLNYLLPDSYSYIQAAKDLYSNFNVHPIRPLLYPLMIGLPFLWDASIEVVVYWSIFLNLIFWFLQHHLIYKILGFFASKKEQFYGSLIFSLSFGLLAMIFQPLTEISFAYFSLLAVFFFLRYQKEKKDQLLLLSISIFLLSVLIRPGILYPAITFLFYGLWVLRRNFITVLKFWPLGLVLFLFFLQLFKMNEQLGTFKISNIDNYTWYTYLGAEVEADQTNGIRDEIQQKRTLEINNLNSWSEKNKLASKDLKSALKNAPFDVFKNLLFNLFNNITGKSNAVESMKIRHPENVHHHFKNFFLILSRVENFLFGFILILIIPLLLFLKKIQMNQITWILFIYLIYSVFVSGISFWQGDRFSIVCYPVLIVLSYYFLAQRKLSLQQQEK